MTGKPTYEELEQRVWVLEKEASMRRQAEAELREQHDLFDAVINAIPMALFSKDRTGRYSKVNDNFAEYFGLPAGEIVGRTVYECWPYESARVYHEKDMALLADGGVQIYEYCLPHSVKGPRDGIFTKASFHNADGSVAGIVGTFMDITDRKRMEGELALHRTHLQELVREKTRRLEEELAQHRLTEKALRQSQNRYRTLFESASDTILILKEGRITDCNLKAQEMFGCGRGQIVGRRITRFFAGEQNGETQPERTAAAAMAAAMGGETQLFEWRHKKHDGTVFDTEVSLNTIVLATGPQLLASIRDISKRKRSEEALRLQQLKLIQADRMISLGILVSGVAHEINNPNNFIMLNTPILADAWQGITPILAEYYRDNGEFMVAGIPYSEAREDLRELFSGITEGSLRIKRIVADLKDYARQEGPELTGELDVNAALEKALALLGNMVKSHTAFLEVRYGKGLPPVSGNGQRFEQVLINLIQNACQALGDPSRGIRIATRYDPAAGRVIVRIRDEGGGIAEKNMKHIFDPFFTTKRSSGGTGLGLSISAAIVKELGGTLSFDSREGEGTTATVAMPALQPDG